MRSTSYKLLNHRSCGYYSQFCRLLPLQLQNKVVDLLGNPNRRLLFRVSVQLGFRSPQPYGADKGYPN